MWEAIDAVLPWLSTSAVQFVAAGMLVALIVASWVAVFATTLDELDVAPAVVATTLSVALGIGALALGRLGSVQLALQFAALPVDQQGGLVPVTAFLLIAEVVAGALLLMGLALQWSFPFGFLSGSSSGTVSAFRVIVGAGLVLWLVHEIVLMVQIAHGAV